MSYASAWRQNCFQLVWLPKFLFSIVNDVARFLLPVALPGLSTPVDNYVCNYFVISGQSFKALV